MVRAYGKLKPDQVTPGIGQASSTQKTYLNKEIHGRWKDHQDPGRCKLELVQDGKVEVFKERLKIDEETKTITAVGIEGDCMKHYKKYTLTLQVISRGGSNFAKFSIDYEKLNENEPAPTKYLDWLVHTGKDLDASLVKA